MIRIFAVGLVLGLFGCTKTVSSKLAAYPVGSPPVTQVVKTSGTYDLRWVDEKGKRHHEFAVNSVRLQKGDVVGIGMTDDGKLLAMAAGAQIGPLAVPPEAKHCLWYHKSTRQTQLGKNIQASGLLAGDIAEMITINSIESALGLEQTDYEIARDKKHRLRLTEERKIPPQKNESFYRE